MGTVSATAGTSGRTDARVALLTASARIRPALTCGNVGKIVPNIHEICPLRRSIDAGASPLYGTCVIVTLVIRQSSAPPRCVAVPTPPEPYAISPGLARASAINCCTVRTGSDGLVTSKLGEE